MIEKLTDLFNHKTRKQTYEPRHGKTNNVFFELVRHKLVFSVTEDG